MRTRILAVIGIGLLAAMGSTYTGSDLQGVVANGSNIQGVSSNGSNIQGTSWNGSNLQRTSPNESDPQTATRATEPSTGLKLRGVHVVGGQLRSGDAPSRTPKKD
jgi:uncharacterized protein YjbI with pentapeptide repeats